MLKFTVIFWPSVIVWCVGIDSRQPLGLALMVYLAVLFPWLVIVAWKSAPQLNLPPRTVYVDRPVEVKVERTISSPLPPPRSKAQLLAEAKQKMEEEIELAQMLVDPGAKEGAIDAAREGYLKTFREIKHQ